MPLVLLSGHPASGKSAIASLLAAELLRENLEVLVISEDSLDLERNAAYKDSTAEKKTRGLLKSAVDRSLRSSRVVILDSLNSIKGYRYELWCLAKAAATRYCVVHCETPAAVAREWNGLRSKPGYSPEVFEDLIARFEPPDTRNRWDTPLVRVDARSEHLADDLRPAVAAVTGRSTGARPAAVVLTPNLATTNPELSTTNLLNELDRAAQEVVSAVMEAQMRSGGEAAGVVEIPGIERTLHLDRAVSLPVLRRQKRAFLKLATQNNWIRLRQAEDARKLFVEFLEEDLE